MQFCPFILNTLLNTNYLSSYWIYANSNKILYKKHLFHLYRRHKFLKTIDDYNP